MSQYALHLPEALFEAARKLAEADNVSMNQFFAMVIAEKVAASNIVLDKALIPSYSVVLK